MKGSGKTSVVLNKTNSLDRLLIWDFLREYQNGRIVESPAELIDLLVRNYGGHFRLIYRPNHHESLEKHFDAFTRAAYSMRNITVVLEELDKVSAANQMSVGLQDLINYGRHRAIDIYAMCRRASQMPRDMTANADMIISFFQQEPRDIKYLGEYMGASVADAVGSLQISNEDKTSDFVEWESRDYRIGRIHWITKEVTYPVENKVDPIEKTLDTEEEPPLE